MARLSDDEKRMLKKLQEKAEAPDAPSVGRSINVTIDLGDEKQVARAVKLGLLDPDDEDTDVSSDDDDDEDETPKRRGYFKE